MLPTAFASMDPLTGLKNRQAFDDSLRREVERARTHGLPLGLVVFDLDRFDAVNARLGQTGGNEALRRFGELVAGSAPRADLLSRLGGDEFAVIAAGAGEPEAYLIAERVRHQMNGSGAAGSEAITVSAGVAVYPRHAKSSSDLRRSADAALFGAKRMGGDRTEIYGAEVGARLSSIGAKAEQEGGLAMLLSLAAVVDIRHYGAQDHSRRVGRYAEAIALELGLDQPLVDRTRLAGMLHDVGKIGVPASILNRPGPLTSLELAEVSRHPMVGGRIVRSAGFDEMAGWIAAHHERPDGSGYPARLSGDQVPLGARILAVADAYDAMTSDRVYRAAMTPAEARAEVRAGAGSQFYREVAEHFVAWLGRRDDELQERAASSQVGVALSFAASSVK
jgi:diguanylate cyclase (GGDEF)-like protein